MVNMPPTKRQREHTSIVMDSVRMCMVEYYHEENESLYRVNDQLIRENKRLKRERQDLRARLDQSINETRVMRTLYEDTQHALNYENQLKETALMVLRRYGRDHPESDQTLGSEIIRHFISITNEYYPRHNNDEETTVPDSEATESDTDLPDLQFILEETDHI